MRLHSWEVFDLKNFPGLEFNPARVEAFTLVIKKEPVLVLRFTQLTPGTVEVTLYPGKNLFKWRRQVLASIRRDMDDYAIVRGITRWQANTEDTPGLRSFTKRFGFKIESKMERFCGGKDHLMWVKFSEIN